jgi:hypothetical protein
MENDPRLEKIERQVESLVQTGYDTRSIRVQLLELGLPGELIDLAISSFRSRQDHVYDLEDPYVITSEKKRTEGVRWYAGPNASSERWNFVKSRLEIEGRSEGEIAEVLHSSATVLGLLDAPGSKGPFASRGLVLGYVQSGKTTNFISTIAQAADANYRLIIVLSGVTNNLRRQTQERLERSLTGANPNNWHWLTSLESDFHETKNANDLLSSNSKRIIAVVKKNNSRLKGLKKWLNSAPPLTRQNLSVLFIDDEADQATLNSARALNRQTAINKTLTEILHTSFLPKHAYLGYTATPFANILSDARTDQQLFPKDFIYPLKRPENYFGPEQLFGRNPLTEEEQEIPSGRNIVIPIKIKDRIQLGKIVNTSSPSEEPTIPDSLLEALKWFFLATATRKWRSKKNRFSTMLVHTSGRIFAHESMKELIKIQIAEWQQLSQSKLSEILKETWEREKHRGRLPHDESLPAFAEIAILATKAVSAVKLITDNSRSDDRLAYDFENEDSSSPVIVIGGNTLARGLTLEGLISSYFMRTSSYYDSLLQMGRWFGYRFGYEDLQRIWMQDDLIPMFRDLALVEEEVRTQIANLAEEGLQPIQVPIKIRDHPILSITAPNKMNYARKIQVGYSEKRTESITFSNKSDWLNHNIQSTKNFIKILHEKHFLNDTKNPQGYNMASNVPWSLLKKYIHDYYFVETARIANGDLITKYVDMHQDKGELEEWNVFFYKTQTSNNPPLDLGHGISISPINRSAKDVDPTTGILNIHHLVSTIDGAADLPISRVELQSIVGKKPTDTIVRKARIEFGLNRKGLLGIYVVDKKSQASSEDRISLDLEHDIIGLGFFFPTSSLNEGVVDYYGPDLPEENEFEDDYLDDADQQDEGEVLNV